MFSSATRTEWLTVDLNTETYELTRRRFSRETTVRGDLSDVDILLIKGGPYGSSIIARNRKGKWMAGLASNVPNRSARETAEAIAKLLGLKVSTVY